MELCIIKLNIFLGMYGKRKKEILDLSNHQMLAVCMVKVAAVFALVVAVLFLFCT